MLKRMPFYFLSFLLLFSCEKKGDIPEAIKEDIIIKLQEKATSNNLDSNYIYLKKADRLIKKNSFISDSIKAENNYLKGLYFRDNGNIDSAVVYFHNASEYVIGHLETDRQRDYFYEAWRSYLKLTKYGDCFSISKRFKTLLNENKDYQSLAWFYFFNENTYKSLKEYKKALKNNTLRVKNLKLANDSLALVRAYISQAELNYYLGNKKETFVILDRLIINKDNLKLSYDHKRQMLGSYGVFLYYEGDYKNALSYYLKALNSTKSIQSDIRYNLLANIYANIAEVQIDLKDYRNAKIYLDSVNYLGFEKIEKRTQKRVLNYHLRLASITTKNISEVTRYIDSIFYYQDKTYIEKYNTELVALTKANDKEKVLLKEKQDSKIKNLKLKAGFWIVLVLLSLLTISGILFYRNRKYKFEKQNLQMQQRLFRSQMNPHFTFNALYAIQNLIKKDPERSSQYLLKFSRLLRIILENSMKNYVQLEDELESLRKYVDLQLLRFPSKFNYTIKLKNMKEDDFLFIPPMLLQPFVENSIEHGFSTIDYMGEIEITLTKQSKFIHCKIEDNGLGISASKLKTKNSTSTQLISNFIKKTSGTKVVMNNKINQGVIVQFLIPYNLGNYD